MTLEELKRIIQEKYLIRGSFTLSSGKKSSFYYDIKGLMGDISASHKLVAELSGLLTYKILFNSIGGIEFGGALVAARLAMFIAPNHSMCFIRKGKRKHGLQKQIEGKPVSPVLLIDDVISRGNTISNAIRVCHANKLEVAGILCVIDRTYVEDIYGRRNYDAPPGFWFYDIKPIGNEKNHLDGLDLPVFALFKQRDDKGTLGDYNKNSFNLFKEEDDPKRRKAQKKLFKDIEDALSK